MENKTKQQRTERDISETLTNGEILMLWRRRRGWNQIDSANYHGVSIFKLKLAEYDKSKDFKYRNFKLGQLSPHEKCLIYRKRNGITQTQLCQILECSREWLRLQESGIVSCSKLLAFWENYVNSTK